MGILNIFKKVENVKPEGREEYLFQKKRIIPPRIAICKVCGGKGTKDNCTCSQCNGSGRVIVSFDVMSYIAPYHPE